MQLTLTYHCQRPPLVQTRKTTEPAPSKCLGAVQSEAKDVGDVLQHDRHLAARKVEHVGLRPPPIDGSCEQCSVEVW